MKLAGKVAVVTGGGSGMGRAVAEAYASEGASVVAADIRIEGAQETAALITNAGGKALPASADISKSAEVQRVISDTVETFGRLDILYNNAAKNRGETPNPDRVADLPEEDWYATIDTNLSGYFLCSKYALPHMIEGGGGVIINVSSTMGLAAMENQAAYMASKHGVIALTKSMALDYGPHNVRVNAICPGSIVTPRWDHFAKLYRSEEEERRYMERIPLRRMGSTDDIASVALFLASDDSAFVTGTHILVDGGRLLKTPYFT